MPRQSARNHWRVSTDCDGNATKARDERRRERDQRNIGARFAGGFIAGTRVLLYVFWQSHRGGRPPDHPLTARSAWQERDFQISAAAPTEKRVLTPINRATNLVEWRRSRLSAGSVASRYPSMKRGWTSSESPSTCDVSMTGTGQRSPSPKVQPRPPLPKSRTEGTTLPCSA